MAKKKNDTENKLEVVSVELPEASSPKYKSIGILRNVDGSYVVKVSVISGDKILEEKVFPCENRAIAMESFKIKCIHERVMSVE